MAIAGAIGPFAFFVARPVNMDVRQPRVEILQFNGVDDAAYRFLGVGSEPWRLQTRVENVSETQAWETLANYADLVNAGLQGITLGNEGFDARNAQVKVLKITPGFGDFPPVRAEKLVGGVALSGSLWIASAEWSLQWVKKP